MRLTKEIELLKNSGNYENKFNELEAVKDENVRLNNEIHKRVN